MNLRRNMLIPAAALVLLVSSCNYLDVSDQLAGGLQNTDEVFEKRILYQTLVCVHIYRNTRLFRT